MPAQPAPVAKGIHDLGNRLELRHRDLEGTGNKSRAAFLGQREGLLLGQAEQIAGRVVRDIAAGRLRGQPLEQVALIGMGFLGQHLYGHRFLGQGFVKAKRIADHDGGGMHHRPQILDELRHEGVQPPLIDRHDVSLPLASARRA